MIVTCMGCVQVDFTFGVEIFEPGHCTTPHTHLRSHELFFILAGASEKPMPRLLEIVIVCQDQQAPSQPMLHHSCDWTLI